MSLNWDYGVLFHYAASFVVCFAIFYIIFRMHLTKVNESLRVKAETILGAEADINLLEREVAVLSEKLSQYREIKKKFDDVASDNAVLADEKNRLKTALAIEQSRNERIVVLQEELASLKKEAASRAKQVGEQQIVIAEQKTRMVEEKKNTEEKLALFQHSREEMTQQFKAIAQKIFDEKGRVINEHNVNSLKALLTPFESRIDRFRQKVEEVYVNGAKEKSALKQEIENLYQLNQKLNKEARNLTRALKGDNKLQGTWGEMILEKILEHSGLRPGVEYDSQPVYRNSQGKLFKPDVVVHLPGKRDVIIDSKVSLVDYERFISESDQEHKDIYLGKHIKAVKNHIAGLSQKDYAGLEDIKSLDFILMFMPVEGAFTAAFQDAFDLFDYGYRKKIIVTSPTTLMVTLKTIENMWKMEHRNRNAMLIAEKAGAIYDKLRGFVEDMDKLGRQINTAGTTYNEAYSKLTSGRGNLVDQANGFVELGVKVKKEMQQE